MDPRELPVPAKWQPTLASWDQNMIAEGLAALTIRTRIKHIRHLARDLGNIDPLSVTEAQLLAWLASFNWARETRRSVHISLRAYFRHAHNGVSGPAERLPKIKSKFAMPRPTPIDVAFDALATSSPRVRLMLRLGHEGGLRRCEICKVHSGDVEQTADGPTLTVHGKGGTLRRIPISESLAAAIRVHDGYVFPGRIDGHLSAQWVGKLCSNALRGPWALHTLRHRAATDIHELVGGDLLVTQQFLGHASVATTQRYVAPNMSKLRRAVQSRASGPHLRAV